MANSNYATKMNEILTEATSKWWNSLSKEDLLAYLAEQPDVTADTLRQMMSGTNCTLDFSLQYDTNQSTASATFYNN